MEQPFLEPHLMNCEALKFEIAVRIDWLIIELVKPSEGNWVCNFIS